MVQYYQQNDTYKALLHYMNTTLTGLFTLECIMKIFSFGFRVIIVTKDKAANRRAIYSVLESASGGPVMSSPEIYHPMITCD